MSFLYLHKGKVRCTEEGFTLPEVKKIWNNDKTGKEKSYFNDVITGIYFIYRPRGIFWLKAIDERIEKVNKDYLKNSKWQDIVLRDGVNELIDVYRTLTHTINDRIIEGLKNDFMELSKAMEKTPMTVRFTLKTTIPVKIPVEGREPITIQHPIERDIEIPNMTQKSLLTDNWLTLSKVIKQVEENLRIEEQERVKNEGEKRIFDSREKFTQPEEENL